MRLHRAKNEVAYRRAYCVGAQAMAIHSWLNIFLRVRARDTISALKDLLKCTRHAKFIMSEVIETSL